MSQVDLVEELGAAVDAGLLDRATAIQRLAEYSDGGLTLRGAATYIDRWQTVRAELADIFMRAEMGLAACRARQGKSDA